MKKIIGIIFTMLVALCVSVSPINAYYTSEEFTQLRHQNEAEAKATSSKGAVWNWDEFPDDVTQISHSFGGWALVEGTDWSDSWIDINVNNAIGSYRVYFPTDAKMYINGKEVAYETSGDHKYIKGFRSTGSSMFPASDCPVMLFNSKGKLRIVSSYAIPDQDTDYYADVNGNKIFYNESFLNWEKGPGIDPAGCFLTWDYVLPKDTEYPVVSFMKDNGDVWDGDFYYKDANNKLVKITKEALNDEATVVLIRNGGIYAENYKPDIVSHTLTVKYVKEDGTEAAPTYTGTVNEGDKYSVNTPDVAGYVADKTVVSGTMGTADTTVTVTYKPTGSNLETHALTIKYVKEDGTEAAPTYTGTVNEGEKYSVDTPDVDGYVADKTVVSGTMGKEDLNVTVTYKPDGSKVGKHTLTINYVDKNNKVLSAKHVSTIEEGKTYKVTSPTIAGYKADTKVVSGTMGKSNVTVTVKYTAEEEVIISGSDNDGTATIEPARNGSSIKTGDETNITNYMVAAALSFILVSLIALKKKFIKE